MKRHFGVSNMAIKAKFVHTNLVARDWRRLAEFYERVFGCVRLPPERNLSGQWLEEVTGIADAHIQGIHLRLPGYEDESGPTLEIFQHNHFKSEVELAVNQPGFAHIAFAVDDVEVAQNAVIEAGGGVVGKRVSVEIPEAGSVTLVYATDPEGNIVELQKWSK